MKNNKQKDFLKTCLNSVNVESTVAEFKQAFCSVCVNPECSRSQWSDSKWMNRMIRQAQALNDPTIVDPQEDPRFSDISKQDFITIDQKTSDLYGGWIDIKEDGKVVHHADPPTETKSSSKVDESVRSLTGKEASEEVPEKEPENTEDEKEKPAQFQAEKTTEAEIEDPLAKVIEPEETPEDTQKNIESDPDPDPEPESESKAKPETKPKKKPKSKGRKKNTEVPEGGITLGEPETKKPQKESALMNKKDPWAAPSSEEKSGGKLTVRISDGEVVKKD